MTTHWTLTAQVKASGPVAIATFATETEARAAYRQAMRDLRDGGYSDEVRDFAIGVPVEQPKRTAEADRMYEALTQGALW